MTSFLELFFDCFDSIKWFIGYQIAGEIMLAEPSWKRESLHGLMWPAYPHVDAMYAGCDGKPRLSRLYASLAN